MTEGQDAYWRERRMKALEKAGDAYCEHVGRSFEFGVHFYPFYFFTVIGDSLLRRVSVLPDNNGHDHLQVLVEQNLTGHAMAGILRAFANKHTRHGPFNTMVEESITEDTSG